MLVNTMLFLSKNKTFPRNLIAKSFIRKISEESKSSIMSSNNIKKRVALINAKVNYGQGKSGTELGPQLLKNNFLFTNFENLSKFKLSCQASDFKVNKIYKSYIIF